MLKANGVNVVQQVKRTLGRVLGGDLRMNPRRNLRGVLISSLTTMSSLRITLHLFQLMNLIINIPEIQKVNGASFEYLCIRYSEALRLLSAPNPIIYVISRK